VHPKYAGGRKRAAAIVGWTGDYRPALPEDQADTAEPCEGTARLARMNVARSFDRSMWRRRMKNPLDSLWGTVISGLVLTVILYEIVKNFLN
jgi:hypothetical protein